MPPRLNYILTRISRQQYSTVTLIMFSFILPYFIGLAPALIILQDLSTVPSTHLNTRTILEDRPLGYREIRLSYGEMERTKTITSSSKCIILELELPKSASLQIGKGID